MEYTIHFDGSCWPNPGGDAAYGTTVDEEGIEICSEAGITGSGPLMSNNVSEFHALAMGFQRLIEFGPEIGSTVKVFGDSNIVINIMKGKWRTNPEKLYFPMYLQAKKLLDELYDKYNMSIIFKWIPRELNTRCDDLSKAHNKSPV